MSRLGKRPSPRQRGYTHRWDVASRIYRVRNPLCVMCIARGKVTAAAVVDHIVPHKGDPDIFWNEANWQSLCATHHSATKQAEEYRGYSTEVGKDGWPIDHRHPANVD